MMKRTALRLLILLNAVLLLPTGAMAGNDDLPRLYIDTTPENSKVIIWNIRPSFTQGMSLLPGDYDVQVQHAGYHAYRETIRIDNSQRLRVKLKPKSYPLKVSLNIPVEDAKIIIWNIKPPFQQGMELPSGEYKLQIQAEGYETYSKIVTIKGMPLNHKVTLRSAAGFTAQSFVSSDVGDEGYPLYVTPKDATVRILNIKPRFKQGMHLLPGKYHLEIKYKNYNTITPWIEIKDGTVYIELLTQKGSVKVANSVSRTVIVEEPINNDDVPPGHYRLNVTTKPADAKIHIFNIQKVYEAGMALKPGRYLLHISTPNTPVHKKWVEIVDQDINIHMDL